MSRENAIASARAAKAIALLAVIDKEGDYTADVVKNLSPNTWAIIANLAGVNKPSADTVKVVLAIMRHRDPPKTQTE